MADQNSRGNAGSSNSTSNSNRSGHVDQNDSSAENRTDKLGKDRVIGRGMTSPDSTEAVLDASTGEPDPRARGEGSLPSGNQSGSQSGSQSGGMSGSTRGQGGSRSAEEESHLSAGKSGGNKNSRS